MNYFELYEIPVSFEINLSDLRARFYALSKKYHPDLFINESDQKQEEVMNWSVLNNKAFKTLSHQEKRTEYILSLSGMLKEDKKHPLPPEFLMEMMEINEVLTDLELSFDAIQLERLKKQVHAFYLELNEEHERLVKSFEHLNEIEKSEKLLSIRDNYYKTKYVLRIKESLHKFAPHINVK